MLLLVHHGDAVGPDVDPMRPLSSAGLAASTALAEAAAARGIKPEVIWHSGKIRAKQTAQLFWRACNPLAGFEAVHGLQPGDPPRWMRDRLLGDTRSILVVGHMPHLPGLLSLLRGEHNESAAPDFPAHGCVALTADGDVWKEIWRLKGGEVR
ncbi:MAG: phosphohistidine phosphatase SixA [Acidobacteria bacterium]|nr:phosphohistidine phosphatase SixA [Acidobacteriota bacterium]